MVVPTQVTPVQIHGGEVENDLKKPRERDYWPFNVHTQQCQSKWPLRLKKLTKTVYFVRKFSIAAFSETTEIDGDAIQNGVIQVFGSPKIHWLEKRLFTLSMHIFNRISGFYRCRASCMEQFTYFSNYFLCFKTSPQLIQLVRRMLQQRLAGKIEKCFVA